MSIDFKWMEQKIFGRALTGEEEAYLQEAIETVTFRKGDSILVQNEPGGALYLLYRGKADVLLSFAGEEIHLNSVSEGAQLGDMSIVDEQGAAATIRATEDCTAYKLTRDALSQLFIFRHDIARDLLVNAIRGMSGVIRNMNESAAAAQSYIHGRRV